MMRVTTAFMLIVACKIYIDGVVGCGVSMSNGVITSNCSGTFTLHHGKTVSTHYCNEVVEKTLSEPALVSTHNCSRVLLDHDQKPHLRKMDGYLVFWTVVSVVLMIVLVPLLVLLIFLCRSKIDNKNKYSMSKIGITLTTSLSNHKFTWKQVVLIGLFCLKPTYSACVSPTTVDRIGGLNQYEYNLYHNEEACFTTGRYSNLGTIVRYSLSHLYDTSDWTHTTWTAKGCGYGDCGSEDECAYWGDIGRVVNNHGTTYLKQCRPHRRALIHCFYKWGCWLSTKGVHYLSGERFSLYQVGKPHAVEQIVRKGTTSCTHSTFTDAGSLTLSHLVLVQGSSNWICPSWSPRGFPKAGQVGDIQYLNTSVPIVDFQAFACDTSSSELSGNCEVSSTGISSLKSNCLKLPAFTDIGLVTFSNGTLWAVADSASRVNLLCKEDMTVIHSTHDCFSKAVRLLGIREEGSLQVLEFTAQSQGSNSTWVVESSCFSDPYEIPCDGTPYGHPIRHLHPEKCTYGGITAVDERTDETGPFWAWDNPDHTSFISETGSISIATVILVVIVLCILRLVCH